MRAPRSTSLGKARFPLSDYAISLKVNPLLRGFGDLQRHVWGACLFPSFFLACESPFFFFLLSRLRPSDSALLRLQPLLFVVIQARTPSSHSLGASFSRVNGLHHAIATPLLVHCVSLFAPLFFRFFSVMLSSEGIS